SREVKSTGAKSRVVVLPSTVMAKVALTNGRLEMWERPLRRELARPARTRDAEVPPTFLFRFGDLMLERGNFALHLPHPNTAFCAARLVEEIDNPAGRTADQDDEKSQGTN